MNKKDVKKISDRILELTQRWESNQVKIIQHQKQILQLQREVQRLLEVDQSIRGGISELERLLKSHAPEEEEKEENQEE